MLIIDFVILICRFYQLVIEIVVPAFTIHTRYEHCVCTYTKDEVRLLKVQTRYLSKQARDLLWSDWSFRLNLIGYQNRTKLIKFKCSRISIYIFYILFGRNFDIILKSFIFPPLLDFFLINCFDCYLFEHYRLTFM